MTAQIEFTTFVPEVETNPYTDTITQLINGGENAAVTLTVDAADEKRDRLRFAKAANAQDKTARLRVRDDSKVKFTKGEDGEDIPSGPVKLTFTLTKRHAARRGTSETEATEQAE